MEILYEPRLSFELRLPMSFTISDSFTALAGFNLTIQNAVMKTFATDMCFNDFMLHLGGKHFYPKKFPQTIGQNNNIFPIATENKFLLKL